MVTQLTSLVTQNLYEEGSDPPTPGIYLSINLLLVKYNYE